MEKHLKRKKIIDQNSKITSEDIENCTDVENLYEMKETIMANLIAAKQQIATAQGKQAADGVYSDPEWWAKVNGYKRVLGYLHQKCQMKERELKKGSKEPKDVATIAKCFMIAAEEELEEDVYFNLLSLAHQMYKENNI